MLVGMVLNYTDCIMGIFCDSVRRNFLTFFDLLKTF